MTPHPYRRLLLAAALFAFLSASPRPAAAGAVDREARDAFELEATADEGEHDASVPAVHAAAARCDLWSRGGYDLDATSAPPTPGSADYRLRLGPVRKGRRVSECLGSQLRVRGGDGADTSAVSPPVPIDARIDELTGRYGPRFAEAIKRNEEEHAADCRLSCESFYCAPPSSPSTSPDWRRGGSTDIKSYSFGGLPPEDFADDFGFPLDLIKVTRDEPLFGAEESAAVLANAIAEGVDANEYRSGKYRLGGDWLTNLPETRRWFNEKLETTFFPLLADLFPEVVSSPSVLRAHSVSLLKYNATHPRTDVHIDNGVLAMTLAMTPRSEYEGGGTFYEHFGADDVLPMDVGHGTFRPGSVRHGGHRVTSGTRFILGAFLLIEDRVEHVRRLKNRGADLRNQGDLDGAMEHFEWALGINPRCATCLKDWAEVLMRRKDFGGAESKIRRVLDLLDDRDSDALFTLGVILSEQGRDDESIESYRKSLALNAEDAELCYNLGVKLAARNDSKGEREMYAKATQINPSMGRAWLNLGISLAETGDLDDAEVMFAKAAGCEPEVRPQALTNLALLAKERVQRAMARGDASSARTYGLQAGRYLDEAKPLFDALVPLFPNDEGLRHYAAGFDKLRIFVFRLSGAALLQLGEFADCESEMARLLDMFPGAWESHAMMTTVLMNTGRADEAEACRARMNELRAGAGLPPA